jgi:hypothetical protein
MLLSFDMGGINRQSLLAEAAEQIDLQTAHLGDRTPQPRETKAGELLRALHDGDVAEFAAFPTLYRITEKHFLEHNRAVPVRFEQLARDCNFYWLYLPMTLFPARNWAFNRLEVAIEFNPGSAIAHTRPTAYQILPQKHFQTLLEVSDSLEIRIGENFEFIASASVPPVQMGVANSQIDAGVDVKAATKMGLVVGPFEYRIKRARIDHTAPGLEKVFWRLDGAQFFQNNDVPLIVIVQVPRETQKVQITAAMQAYRFFNLASADLQQAIQDLPKALRDFFSGGIPLRDEKLWDITPRL